MAIVQCPECGGKVSTNAGACPHCGYPLNETRQTEDDISVTDMEADTPISLSPQILFNEAYKIYKKGLNLIEELSVIARKVEPEFSTDIAKRQFDRILQTLLFRVALSDNRFTDVEAKFIDQITDTSDALNYIREKTELTSVSWDNIFMLSVDVCKGISATLVELLDESLNDFILNFAILDAAIEGRDIHTEFVNIFAEIAFCLSAVDGAASAQEKATIRDCILEMIGQRWMCVLNEAKKNLNQAEQD